MRKPVLTETQREDRNARKKAGRYMRRRFPPGRNRPDHPQGSTVKVLRKRLRKTQAQIIRALAEIQRLRLGGGL